MSRGRIGVIGSGAVGKVLAAGFAKHGYETMIGTREPERLAAWAAAAGALVRTGSVEATVRFADVLVLAVKGSAAEQVVGRIGAAALAGKTVLDATNPIADSPPENGVLRFFTTHDQSLMERLQHLAPAARFVKAFSCVGNALMVDPALPGGPPTMFICGDDPAAKGQAAEIFAALGWETEDLGTAQAARAIEPLCMLWCIPGFLRNDWVHAFKMLRP